MIDRPDWGAHPEAARDAPVKGTETAPAITADDLALLDGEEFDDDSDEKLIASGAFTREELAKHYGRSPDEIAPPKLSRQDVDAELAKIAERRRVDKKGYFKDEAMQARERELIELHEKLKANPASADDDGSGPDDGSGLDPALIEEWQSEGGVDYHLKTARETALTAIDALDPNEGAALIESFDGLPKGAQSGVFRFLAIDGGASRPASEADMKRFGSTEEGSELIAEWRSGAARKVGRVQSRATIILSQMAEGDRAAAQSWFAALPPKQAKAVVRALAGK